MSRLTTDRRMGPSGRRVGVLVGVAVTGLLLASCAQVPDHGTVKVVAQQGASTQLQAGYYNPKPPEAGASQADIVTGFLDAMTAIPLRTSAAQKYLSTQARAQWQPRRVVTYDDQSRAEPRQHHRIVVVRLRGGDQVGSGGQWQGALSPSARRLVFPMVREDNQWRISQAPNALVVPRNFYDQQYQEAEIYFFDPTGRILVPEPVHVVQAKLASSLVSTLLRGPGRSSTGVARSFLPPGLSLVSLPVNDGVADVTLSGPDPGPLDRKTVQLILAQFSWTLRQDTSIARFRVTIDGHELADATNAQVFDVHPGTSDPFDPAVSLASGLFYALRHGLLVSGQIDQPTPVDGPFGRNRMGIGAFAVRLDNNQVAAVTPASLLLGPVSGARPATPVLTMPDLLRPSWDFAGRLWDVQNAPGGARVLEVQHGRHHLLHVPGISGRDVRRFLVSRDGSRLVAVIHGRRSDRIVVSRLRYDASGDPQGGTRARPIPWLSSGTTRIRDIGWTSPTTLEVLDQISHSQAEARILNVDGSTSIDETTPIAIPGVATGLATSPVATQTPYALLRGIRPFSLSLYDLAQDDTARTAAAPTIDTPRLRRVAYAG
jgi:hypothetical protein